MTNSSAKSRKRLLFSVTAADCTFDYIRGSGAGGQKRNKTHSAVRCTHLASRAVGYCEESRLQGSNKKSAFQRMAATKTFKDWHRLEVSRQTGELARIEREVEKQMRNIRVEIRNENGRWVEVGKDEILSSSDVPVRCDDELKNTTIIAGV